MYIYIYIYIIPNTSLCTTSHRRLKDAKFDWTGNVRWVLKNVVPHMGVDTLLINTGLWAEFKNDEEVCMIYALVLLFF